MKHLRKAVVAAGITFAVTYAAAWAAMRPVRSLEQRGQAR